MEGIQNRNFLTSIWSDN